MLQADDLQGSLRALQSSLELSSRLDEASGDVDVLGAIGDAYTDLGNLEKAAEVRSHLWTRLMLASTHAGCLWCAYAVSLSLLRQLHCECKRTVLPGDWRFLRPSHATSACLVYLQPGGVGDLVLCCHCAVLRPLHCGHPGGPCIDIIHMGLLTRAAQNLLTIAFSCFTA